MTFSRQEVFSVSPSAIAFVEGRANPHSITIDKSRIQPDQKGRFTVLANTWIAEITPGYFGVLPRATVTQGFTTTLPTGKVNDCWRYLKAGDPLYVIEPYVELTVSAGWAANDTVTINLDGNTANMIINGVAGILPANIAAEIAAFINTHPMISTLVTAVAAADKVYVYGKNPVATPITITASTAGAGDATITAPAGATALRPMVSIGTISRIDHDGTITLAANAAAAVPVGGHVGMPVVKVFGIYDIDLDMTYLDRYALSPTSEAHGVYEAALPYCDELLKKEFDALNICLKF